MEKDPFLTRPRLAQKYIRKIYIPKNVLFFKQLPLNCLNVHKIVKNALKKCKLARKYIILPKQRTNWLSFYPRSHKFYMTVGCKLVRLNFIPGLRPYFTRSVN